MNAQKWNPRKHEYEPYQIPKEWFTPLYLDDMDTEINCAGCGKEIKFGDSFTSHHIHNSYGMGYPVCEVCYRMECQANYMVSVFSEGSWGCEDE